MALFKGKILGARYIIQPNENFNLINVNLPKFLWIMLSLRNLGTEFLIARTTFALIKIVLSTFQFCTDGNNKAQFSIGLIVNDNEKWSNEETL